MPRLGYLSRSAASKSSAREAGFISISISRRPTARQNGSANLMWICTSNSLSLSREFVVEFFVGDFLVGSYAATHHCNNSSDVFIGEQAIGAFGDFQNFCYIGGVFLDLIPAQEETHVMFTR